VLQQHATAVVECEQAGSAECAPISLSGRSDDPGVAWVAGPEGATRLTEGRGLDTHVSTLSHVRMPRATDRTAHAASAGPGFAYLADVSADVHGLYEQFGFAAPDATAMVRPPAQSAIAG
jgi:hypothetical protein